VVVRQNQRLVVIESAEGVIEVRERRLHAPDGDRRLPTPKLYQDEVYGSKELTPLAVAVIATPEFQRLGHIYQLGTTHNVFRGATHRRFDHSVGTYFMSRTIMRRIVQNHARFSRNEPTFFPHPGVWLSPRLYSPAPGSRADDQCPYSANGRWRGMSEIVSVAALLHDVGHVPVGHTFEDEFSILEKHDGLGGSRMFELFFGPRTGSPIGESQSTVERHFGTIDESRLARPKRTTQRVSLPWLFEEGVYEQFFADASVPGDKGVQALCNWEVRELIFLLLSFKEAITTDHYASFDDLLTEAEDELEPRTDPARRLAFIRELYQRNSVPLDLGPDHERVPLFHPFMSDIVGNTICADLLDYLVRDGARLHLDIRNNLRLQRYLVIRESSNVEIDDHKSSRSRRRLTIYAVKGNGLPRRDTVSDLLDLMRERYRFAEVVYYHPKKCVFSSMFAKALELSSPRLRDGDGIYPAPWAPPYEPAFGTSHIAHVGDSDLLSTLDTAASTSEPVGLSVKELVRRIRYRDEYPLLFTLDHDGTHHFGGPEGIIRHLRDDGDRGRREWEKLFADAAVRAGAEEFATTREGGSLPAVLIYCPHQRMQAKEVAAHVEVEAGRVLPLNQQAHDRGLAQEIDLLNENYKRLWRLYLFVHPKLLARGSAGEPTFAMALNGLVDAFCERFGVPLDTRRRGCRFRYVPLRQRLEPVLDPVIGSIRNAPRDRILELVGGDGTQKDFWGNALGEHTLHYPITDSESRRGVAFATLVCAASASNSRLRESWPGPLQAHKSDSFVRCGRTVAEEEVRKAAMARLQDAALNLVSTGEQRSRPIDWGVLVERASDVISSVRQE